MGGEERDGNSRVPPNLFPLCLHHWEYLLPFTHLKYGTEFVFLQDNAPIHTFRETKEFFSQMGLTVMNWPARSLTSRTSRICGPYGSSFVRQWKTVRYMYGTPTGHLRCLRMDKTERGPSSHPLHASALCGEHKEKR